MKKSSLPKIKNPLKAPKMKLPKKVWDKEFEDELWTDNSGFGTNYSNIYEMFKKYIGLGFNDTQKVKIKCRKGCIQIERIK